MARSTTDKPTPEDVRVKYQTAIHKNISESEILWSRYNSMLVFHSILIAVIGFIYDKNTFIDRPELREGLVFFLPRFGIVACFLWFMMTIRGFQWIGYWIDSARKLEKEFLKDECDELNPVLAGNEYRSRVIGWPKTPLSSYALIILIGLLYVVLLRTGL